VFSWPTNYESCYTLAGVVSREGIGLHSGDKTSVTISPYEKEGYYVSFKDKPNKIFELTQDLIGSTMLCTAVKLEGRNLYTIEHLLSAMAGCGLSYIHIEVDGKEIPLLDGSAIQWVRDFEEVGIKKAPRPENFFREINKSIILNKED
jgi:UDP-3-O-[3-hydroxymyristoyl] N-acetylglucosamine deacetylase